MPAPAMTTGTARPSFPVVATTYELFSKLPAELRLRIWQLAPQCYISLKLESYRKNDSSRWQDIDVRDVLLTTPRILNAVNQESRYATKKNYTFLDAKYSRGRVTPVEFNRDCDALYIRSGDNWLPRKIWLNYIVDLRAAGVTITKLLIDIRKMDWGGSRYITSVARVLQPMDEILFVLGAGPKEMSRIVTPGKTLIRGSEWAQESINPKSIARILHDNITAIKRVARKVDGGKMPVIKIMVMVSTSGSHQ